MSLSPIQELTNAIRELMGTKKAPELTPIKVDLTYLCPNDPNRAKVLASNGLVLPVDAPVHTSGFITDTKAVEKKHQTFGPDGRRMEFNATHMTATWICATCNAEIKLDPYR